MYARASCGVSQLSSEDHNKYYSITVNNLDSKNRTIYLVQDQQFTFSILGSRPQTDSGS